MSSLAINLPDVHAEVTAVFARYEHALVNNLVDELDAQVWLWRPILVLPSAATWPPR